MKNIYRHILAVASALCLFATCTSKATAQDTRFYGANMLSSSMIKAIAQDKHGFLWIGTEHGLDRYDGYHFVHYTQLDATKTWATEVNSLYVDRGGHLWVGTARGLFAYDSADDAFQNVAFPDSLTPRVSQLAELANGTLVAGTMGYGLYAIDTLSMAASLLNDYAPADDRSYYSHLLAKADGSLWKSGADQRIVCGKPQRKPHTIVSTCGSILGFVQRGNDTYALCQKGLIPLCASTSKPSTLAPAILNPQTTSYDYQFSTAISDDKGNIYIGSRAQGLFWLPAGEHIMRRLPVSATGVNLDHVYISTLFLDDKNNLWVGCEHKGLLMIPLHHRPLFSSWSFASQHIQTTTSVTSIVCDADSMTWVSVPGDGIYGFDQHGYVQAHPHSPSDVETIALDDNGHFWLGTTNGLWSYSPTNGTYKQTASLPGLRVNKIIDLHDGHLAVSAFGAGLFLVNRGTGQVVRHLTMHDTDTLHRGRLANDWIHCIDTDRNGCMWIGTASGVCCYNHNTNSFRPYGFDVLLPREACLALRVLASGDVLLGTESELRRWQQKGGLTTEQDTEALQGQSISYIAEDNHRDLWLSTNDGLWRWSPTTKTLTSFAGASGLQAREFALGAGLQTVDGNILLGSADGITAFHPGNLRTAKHMNERVQLTALVVGGQHANANTRSNGRRIMDGALSDCNRFRLSYVDATFQLEFSLLRFDDAADITYEYRFADEENWTALTRGNNTLAFNHMPIGDYTLEVRARMAEAVSDISTYHIRVLPPWWRSTWAYIIYIILLIMAAIAGIKAYNRNIQHRHDQEKLHLLLRAINAEDTPLSLNDMQRAISSFVQSRKNKRGIYGDVEAMANRVEAPQQQGNDEALMERIMQSVNQHLSDSEFSVDQLCSEVGISRAHLHRKMKDMTGMSVTEFIRNIRLEQAARMLRERKLNITQVAYSVGFSTLGYFTTVFRKQFGVSPREYVNQAADS